MATDITEEIGDAEFDGLEFDLSEAQDARVNPEPKSSKPAPAPKTSQMPQFRGPAWGRENNGIEQAVLALLDNEKDFSSTERRASRQIAEFLICVKGLCIDLNALRRQEMTPHFKNRLKGIMAVADRIASDRLEVLEENFEREGWRQFLNAFEALAELDDEDLFPVALESFKKAARKLFMGYLLAVQQDKLPVPKNPVHQEVFSREEIL